MTFAICGIRFLSRKTRIKRVSLSLYIFFVNSTFYFSSDPVTQHHLSISKIKNDFENINFILCICLPETGKIDRTKCVSVRDETRRMCMHFPHTIAHSGTLLSSSGKFISHVRRGCAPQKGNKRSGKEKRTTKCAMPSVVPPRAARHLGPLADPTYGVLSRWSFIFRRHQRIRRMERGLRGGKSERGEKHCKTRKVSQISRAPFNFVDCLKSSIIFVNALVQSLCVILHLMRDLKKSTFFKTKFWFFFFCIFRLFDTLFDFATRGFSHPDIKRKKRSREIC